MKQLTIIFFSAFCLTSCNNGAGEQREQGMMKEPAKHSGMANLTAQDPVCEMPKDTSWTDYTIYNKDTVWFCSEGCKKAFEARPAKFMKK